ncbi:MAG: hypothetical protein ABI778_08240, partial [Ignavibacteriota bacterium]
MTTRRLCSIALSVILACFISSSVLFAQADNSKRVLARGLSDTHAENLQNLNSSSNDATPVISADEGTLYFTSYRKDGKQMLYRSKRKSLSEWSDPEVFFEVPGKGAVCALSVTADGKNCVLQGCNLEDGIFSSCDIYEANIEGGTLTGMHSLGLSINTEWWDAQPSLSHDGQLLFFSSDRKHGSGGMDIYMCARNASGTWGEPLNLAFNTSGDEVSPYIASDNQTLYFSANGLPGGFGGFDIYVTHRNGENQWSEPKNLGEAVNTKSNEMFFFVPQTEDAVYLSSDRPGGLGGLDIYRIVPNVIPAKPKFIAFRGSVLDAETNKPVRSDPDTKLVVSSNGENISNTGSARNYSAMAPIGKMIRVNAGANGYVNGNIEVQAPSVFDSVGFSQDIKLVPAKARIIGHVTNVFTNKPLASNIVLEGGMSPVTVVTDAVTGAFSFDADPFKKYKLSVSLKDYEPYETQIEIPLKREAMITVEKEVRLTTA